MMLSEIIKSLFFNIYSMITLENVMRIICASIGIIYMYVKYNFKITYMPTYLYDFNENDLDVKEYQEILNNYETSVFIMTVIEGIIIIMILIQHFISPSISIEISQSGGYIL